MAISLSPLSNSLEGYEIELGSPAKLETKEEEEEEGGHGGGVRESKETHTFFSHDDGHKA